MHWIGWIMALLFGLVWVGSEFTPGSADTLTGSATYIPPRYGYFPTQYRPVAAPEEDLRLPALHPAVVAALESLICLTALAAFSDPRSWSTGRLKRRVRFLKRPESRPCGVAGCPPHVAQRQHRVLVDSRRRTPNPGRNPFE